jgi:hypothetical protein
MRALNLGWFCMLAIILAFAILLLTFLRVGESNLVILPGRVFK